MGVTGFLPGFLGSIPVPSTSDAIRTDDVIKCPANQRSRTGRWHSIALDPIGSKSARSRANQIVQKKTKNQKNPIDRWL